MKPQSKRQFASTLLIGAALAVVLVSPDITRTAIAAETHPVAAQEQAGGTDAQPRSPLFEALEARASEDAARRTAGTGGEASGGPGAVWDRERAFLEMERLRAEIVTLSGLSAAQKELLLWNRERIKSGAAPAVLPARLCRAAALGDWCPLLPATFDAPRTAPGNKRTKDELQ